MAGMDVTFEGLNGRRLPYLRAFWRVLQVRLMAGWAVMT